MTDRNENQTHISRARMSAAGRDSSRNDERRKTEREIQPAYVRPPLWADEREMINEEGVRYYRGSYTQRRTSPGKGRWVIIVVLLFIILICAVAGYMLLTSTYFKVSDIQLRGVSLVDYDEVLSFSGVKAGGNMLLINPDRVAAAVEDHPMIDAARVERSFPQTVIITVVERAPRAAVQTVSQFIIVDEYMNIINIAAQPPNTDIPVIEGVLAVDVQPGQALTLDNATQKDALKIILTTLYNSNAFYLVDRINVADTNDIKLYNGNSLAIEIGDYNNMESKIMWISVMLPRLIQQGYSSGTLRVGTGRDYSFVTDQTTSITPAPEITEAPSDAENADSLNQEENFTDE
ncbi:MAG: cell division protein FtsQ/DivIB [Christensenellales bacterium]|jgi:cell division protein FtsQ